MIQPQYFDILGMLTFAILLYVGIAMRKKEKIFSKILILIGIFGLIIDGYSLITNFILK